MCLNFRRPSITTEDDALSFKTAKSSTPPKTEVEPVITLEEMKDAQLETAPKVTLPRLESRELSVDRTNNDLMSGGVGSSAILATNAKVLLADFRNASQYLDFEKFPVYDLQEWEKRLKVSDLITFITAI